MLRSIWLISLCIWKRFPLFAILLLAAERTEFMLVLAYFCYFFHYSLDTEISKSSGSTEKFSMQNSSILTERLGTLQVLICIRK